MVAGAAALLACAFWLGTLQQPLIDRHEFRQTQTALSALFMQPGLDGDFQERCHSWAAFQAACINGSCPGSLSSSVG